MALEAIALDRQTEHYTYAEVERMLWRWFAERPQVNLHGKLTHKPRTAGGTQLDRWASVQVNEALLEKIDLYLAYKKLPSHYRRIILLWYGSGWSVERIVAWYKQNGYPRLHRRTIFKWRRQAVEALVNVLGKKA